MTGPTLPPGVSKTGRVEPSPEPQTIRSAAVGISLRYLPSNPPGLAYSRARRWRKSSVCEVLSRKIPFEPRVPISSDVFGEKVKQKLDFRGQV